MAFACLRVNLEDLSKYLSPSLPHQANQPLVAFPPSSKADMSVGQNILSRTSCRIAGISVRAASMATRMLRARHIPMVETRLIEHIDITPNPIITDAPEVAMDSPAHLMDSWRALSWPRPARRPSR